MLQTVSQRLLLLVTFSRRMTMLNAGSYLTRDCQGWSRRSFLSFAAGLPFAGSVLSAAPPEGTAAAPKARSVMLIWRVGRPGHMAPCVLWREPGIAPALHLMNSETTTRTVEHRRATRRFRSHGREGR